jgi:uncharacterized membrane protein YkgB
MGGIIGGFFGACFAGICCGACRQCGVNKTGAASRLPYIFLFFIAGLFAIVMSLYGEKSLNLTFTSVQTCNSDTCTGNGSVYRVSFCLFVFELLHVIIIGGGAVSFHWLWFAIKFLVFVAALTATFLITGSNSFFDGYADYFARYLSAFYLLIQILILISWGYETNDYLQTKSNEIALADPENQDRDEDEQKSGCNKYLLILVLGSALIFIGAFIFLGLFFPWYAPSGCTLHETLIVITIVFCILNAVLSVVIGNGSFFVAAVVSFYCTFLLFSAIQADPDANCNQFANNRDTVSLWVGYILTFFAIFYAALRADQIGLLFLGPPNIDDEESEQPLLDGNYEENNANGKNKATGSDDDIMATEADLSTDKNVNADANEDANNNDNNGNANDSLSANQKALMRRHNVYFHTIMMLAACYFAMLFTNWGTSNGKITQSGKISLWVNMSCQWLTIILFWQTLLAPVLCASRFARHNNDEEDEEV